jgi:DNA-binding transcriptional LysR family regulator
MIDLKMLRVFVKVAELRSFGQAARSLGIIQSGASNSISRLEYRARCSPARPYYSRSHF